MARLSEFKLTVSEKQKRRFSDNFKQQKVREIELGKSKVSEISKQYQVGRSMVYRWMDKFGAMQNKKERLIIESDSDTAQLLALKKKVADLERIIGQKQVIIDFKDKMIDLAEEAYGVDIKKKYSTRPQDTFGKTGKDTISV